MNTISQTEANIAAGYTAVADNDKTAQKTTKDIEAQKTRVMTGKTIGNPELSEKAQKYYEQLKKKYYNMDFILVSEDKKAEAQANAGKYANANRMVVLIDTEKIERMAVDEEYRKQYEGIISGASGQLAQLKNSLGANAGCVKTYGMQVNDGGNASFFAVVDKSMAAQRERIAKKAAQKKEADKKAKKEAEQKRTEERRAEKAEEKKRAEKQEKADKIDKTEEGSGDTVTVTASSIDELIRKINDTIYSYMSDHIQTPEERQVGQKFDFSI